MPQSTNKPSWIVVHHTAVSYAKNPAQFLATDTFHKGKGFPKSSLGYYVGYHAMVEKDGTLRTARKDTELGAHTSQDGINFLSVAICFTGDFDKEEPTIEQCRTALAWIKGKRDSLNVPTQRIVPHRHFATKSCWGDKLPDDIVGYLERRLAVPTIPTVAPEAQAAWARAKAKGIVSDKTNPEELVQSETLQWVFKNLGVMSAPSEGKKMLQWYILAMDRLGLFTNT